MSATQPLVEPSKGATPFAPKHRAATVEEAILSRRSVRQFTDEPVPKELVEKILAVSSRAPSGTNIQPWKVRVLAGSVKDRARDAMMKVCREAGEGAHKAEFRYYPEKWRDPYLARRRKVGWDLYGLLGITRDNKEGLARQHWRNFEFFDAPVALIFTMDRDLEIGSWLDYGMFLQNVMIAARGEGLDTCPQAALANAQDVLRKELAIPDTEFVICGMSLGWAADDKVNTLVTVREPVAAFATFEGF